MGRGGRGRGNGKAAAVARLKEGSPNAGNTEPRLHRLEAGRALPCTSRSSVSPGRCRGCSLWAGGVKAARGELQRWLLAPLLAPPLL